MGGTKGKQAQPTPEMLDVIKQLSDLLDLVGFQAYIGRKTRYGDKPGPSPWHYTSLFLSEYAPGTQVEDVQRLFESVGAHSEVDAAMFVVANMKYVP